MGENRLMADLYEEHQRLKERIKELEEKHWNECRQIAHYDDELRRAKELLKKAVEDFKTLGIELDSNCELCGFRLGCEECPLHRAGINCRCWNKRDEALALLGKDIDVPAAATDINVGGKIDSWISCEDRLPNHYEEVLVVSKLENIVYFAWYDADISMFMGHSHMWTTREVTHWMPLPKPPKE